jgi:hypothetical protein
MKKLLFFICTLLCANVLFAQENIKKEKDLAVVVDSLSAKLKELQHNYDYLYCKNQLTEINHSLIQDRNSIDIGVNNLKFEIYHGRFNYDLYNAYKKGYNSNVEKLDSDKIYAESLKEFMFLKTMTSNFTESEIQVLQHGWKVFDNAINAVESSLNLYKLYLDEYKKKW